MLLRDPQEIETRGGSASTRVWDLPLRLFHWALVAALAGAWASQTLLPDSYLSLHLAFGYAVAALLAFRIVWGWFGSEYSRFSHLKPSPRASLAYLRDFLSRRAAPYLGHNPAGALMIVCLLATLSGIVITGMLVQAGEEKQGPFAGFVSYGVGSAARDFHALLVNLALILIAAHIAAVVMHLLLARESLVRAMFTGRKPSYAIVPTSPRPARSSPAVLTLAGFVAAVVATVLVAERIPSLGVPEMPVNDTYVAECGACHEPYHPSLLPRASWAVLIGGLADHFGEDASLPPEEVAQLASYLSTYGAEAWDTEAGRRIAAVSPNDPLRITTSPYWARKHRWIPPDAFAAAAVKAKSHCSACHADADSGRFADQAITYEEGLHP